MARPAPIRLAGTIAATVMCAAAATEAAAQTPPPGGAVVLNEQLQLGDLFAGQTLNVVDAQDQVTASTAAAGNSATGAVQNDAITVRSEQTMQGDAVATTDLTLGGDTIGAVTAVTQAGGNYLGVSAYDAGLSVEAVQSNAGGLVSATSRLGQDDARLLGGGYVAASAVSNTVAVYGEGSAVDGTVDQDNAAAVRAYSRVESQYVPAEAVVDAEAMANVVAVTSGQTSGQAIALRQTSSGALVEAEASANAGNAWDLAGRARAAGNRAVLYNQGGAVVASAAQDNGAYVRAAATTTAYDFGRAEAQARGVANELSVGNNDIFVQIDASQINTGGVDVTATFAGTNGYDAYVGAEAVGNSVTGYACSECQGRLDAASSQVNHGDVSATANTTVAGSGRAVITGANAVGNAATFHVSRPN